MTEIFDFKRGSSPLLVSVPHDGRAIDAAMRGRMSPAGLDIPDTDWHVARLYDFVADTGASTVVANYSRYVVDLNRASTNEPLYDDAVATGLCPSRTFSGDDIYLDGYVVDDAERQRRIDAYWRPYHERIASCLAALRDEHGYALLWDAHSIPSRVPRLFDGELPVLNIGSYAGRSADERLVKAVGTVAGASGYACVIDGRFKGGHITRHYGNPDEHVHSLQLEIAQRAYMDEQSRAWHPDAAGALQVCIGEMLSVFTESAARLYS